MVGRPDYANMSATEFFIKLIKAAKKLTPAQRAEIRLAWKRQANANDRLYKRVQ
jgi:hypothetical protein